VNALTAGRKSVSGKLIGGGARGGDDEDLFVVGFFGEECGGAMEERGVGAGVKERARDHRQLYWVEISQGVVLVAGNGERDEIAVRSHECERGTHECVRHNAFNILRRLAKN
jgi:hypothetical protein